MENNNTNNSNNKTNNVNINVEMVTSKRCYKCLSVLNVEGDGDINIVKDHCNRLFCGTSCRSQYYAEINHDKGSLEWSEYD